MGQLVMEVRRPLPTLRRVLPPQEWDALLSVSAELPLWLAELLSEQAP
ncbi:MAG: hypothetical protein HQ469_01360 [Cyanobacteria bacterium]|nr:hypothetical protein [Cyanobacteria bacterium bin.275]